jgi:hypothetical protein
MQEVAGVKTVPRSTVNDLGVSGAVLRAPAGSRKGSC